MVFVLGWFDFFDFFCMSITYSVRWKNRIAGFIRIVLSSDVLIFFILYNLIYSAGINLCWGWPFRAQRYQYYNGFISPQLPCGSWRSEFRMLILISNISIRRLLAEADRWKNWWLRRQTISIHSPLAEADSIGLPVAYHHFEISIHSPLAEADGGLRCTRPNITLFNPQPPRGSWRIGRTYHAGEIYFSIHSPLAEADLSNVITDGFIFFSIHSPLAEADLYLTTLGICYKVFQSTAPSRKLTYVG